MKRIVLWLFATVLALLGLALAAGGLALLREGGSGYYLAAGIATLACALALIRGSGHAAAIFAGLLFATLGWSLWEVGLDGWALTPRLVAPAVVGCLFLLLRTTTPAHKRGKRLVWAAVLSVAAVIAWCGIAAQAALPGALPAIAASASVPTEWRNWGNAAGGGRYVPASQISTANVDRLQLAWRYESPIAPQPVPSMEATPLLADGRLYMCLQPGIVAALDPDSGRELWRYVSPAFARTDFLQIFGGKCRGVSFYEAPRPLRECAKRVLFSTPDGLLMAIDAATGRPCSGFGRNGSADLRAGMGLKTANPRAIKAMPSSPPAIVRGIAVVGQTISDFGSIDAPSGVIRGYDAETGELRWAWDAGRPGRTHLAPGETYTPATPNAWGVLSGDEALGLVFVPTGNSLPDYYGGQRPDFSDRVASSIVAIDVSTGLPRWSFQTVHHDLWDHDIAAQPVAVDIPTSSGAIPALIVSTKSGQMFVINRRDGTPVDRVEERAVPQGAVPGDRTSPTQPYTTGFPSLAGPAMREADMWGLTPLDQLWCRIRFKRLHYEGEFTPLAMRDTLMYPGTAGGINWGSVSVDPARGLLVVNTLNFAHVGRLVPRDRSGRLPPGGTEGFALFEQAGTPYAFSLSPFISPIGAPCQKPPYGQISGFDLKTRKLVWSRTLGTAEHSGPMGLSSHLPIRMGVPNAGGSVLTAGGLAFIGAAQDRRLRAFDVRNGRELWSAPLPAIGAATPMSYVSPKTGRQYVVIAAGGHYGIPGPAGRSLLAFALPGATKQR